MNVFLSWPGSRFANCISAVLISRTEHNMATIRITVATIAALFLGTALLTAGPGYMPSRNYSGFIADSICGANHEKMHITPDKECVRQCIRNGAKYSLVTGQNVYSFFILKARNPPSIPPSILGGCPTTTASQ
jgi:hypothetical protein